MTKYLPLNKVIPVMLLYSIITIIGMYHHELWFDEVQHWLIARDSRSFFDLFSNRYNDDHVPLWKILLFIINHFISGNPFAIQVFHLIIINISVFIFLRCAPYNLIAKMLIIFGYYFIFEYSILCRNYALGILFLFIVCTLLSKPEKNLIKIGILLVLMCSTQEFFGFASFGIFLYLLYYNYEQKSLNWFFFIFTCLFLAGFIIVAYQLLHISADKNNVSLGNVSWLAIHNVSFAVHGIDKGFIPFPPLHDPNFWNRHLFESWSSYVKVPVSLLFLTYPVWVIRNSRKALVFYVGASLFLLLFLTVSQMTGSRYFGMFFIYFIAAIWLASHEGANVLLINNSQKRSKINIAAVALFYIILVTQVLAGAYIYEQDYTRPFSQGKNTVQYIRDQHLDRLPIVVDGYNAGPVLSAYFRHPVYYLDIDSEGSVFITKNTVNSTGKIPLMEEIKQSKYLASLNEFILITNRANCGEEIDDSSMFQFNKLQSFQNAIIISENYSVYKAARTPLNTAHQ